MTDTSLSSVANQVIGVAGLTDYLKLLLEEDDHLRKIWVTGEVSSARNHRQGCFFTLHEHDGAAAIIWVVWKSLLSRISAVPDVGEQVTVLGQIRLYPKRGTYQLTVWQVLPAGEGLQALRYKQLKARLAAEGVFDIERKRPLPSYPQTLAVVTSPQAAAWGDIQRTLSQRNPGINLLLSPATVQGSQAPGSIVSAIARVVRDGRAEVIVLARGGGATEDLACFDDERVVMAVATSPIPVITGIGHQRDESLSDLAADAYAHTPTAAAEQVLPSLDDLYGEQVHYLQRVGQVFAQRSQQAQAEVRSLKTRLQRLRLDRQLQQHQKDISWQQQQLVASLNQRLQLAQHQHQLLKEKLATLDPEAVLKRGYAVVRAEEKIVMDTQQLSPGAKLDIQLGHGKLTAIVQTVIQERTSSKTSEENI